MVVGPASDGGAGVHGGLPVVTAAQSSGAWATARNISEFSRPTRRVRADSDRLPTAPPGSGPPPTRSAQPRHAWRKLASAAESDGPTQEKPGSVKPASVEPATPPPPPPPPPPPGGGMMLTYEQCANSPRARSHAAGHRLNRASVCFRFESTYYDPEQTVEPRANPDHTEFDPFHVPMPKLRSEFTCRPQLRPRGRGRVPGLRVDLHI